MHSGWFPGIAIANKVLIEIQISQKIKAFYICNTFSDYEIQLSYSYCLLCNVIFL